MALAIKPEHKPAWEWAAAKAGVSVGAYAQQHLDAAGSSLEAQRLAADKAEYEALFATVLRLTPERRAALESKAHELLAEQGLPVPQE